LERVSASVSVNLSNNEFNLLSVGGVGLNCNNTLSVKHNATGVSSSHPVNQENVRGKTKDK